MSTQETFKRAVFEGKRICKILQRELQATRRQEPAEIEGMISEPF
jgi:hypothetical protein